MAGKPPGRDEDGVAAQIKVAAQGLRASQTRAARPMRRRLVSVIAKCRGVEVVARLDLDEGDRRAAPRDEVDLAAGGGEATIQHLVTLQPQQQRGDRLRRRPNRCARRRALAGRAAVTAASRRRKRRA